MRPSRIVTSVVAGALALAAVVGLGVRADAVELSISCGAVGQELTLCQQGVEAWSKATGHTAKVVSTPNSTTERLALYQQILAAGSSDIDVLQIDVIWPAILARHLVDLTPHVDAATLAKHFPTIVTNNTVDGKLVAMPWFTDAGLLYYRADLLEKYKQSPPRSWEELAATAKVVQDGERAAGNDRMWGYVFQGKPYEGLTCNLLEWVDSFGGGTIIDTAGKITIDNPKAQAALTWVASTVGKIAPPGVLGYAEEEARGVFQSGNAVFMRNWPYAWALAQAEGSAIKGKVGVSALPAGGEAGKPTGTLGGWQLAVSRYTKNQDVAIDLVRFLTSTEEQRRRAVVGSYNPTVIELYKDEEVLRAAPFFGSLFATFENAVPRPSTVTGERYNQVSALLYGTGSDVLAGKVEAKAATAELARRLERLSRGGRW